MFQKKNYFIHESCPPKLRGDGCPRDCFDCVYDEFILYERNELKNTPKIHVQISLPGMCKQRYFRGIKTDGILYTDCIKVNLERMKKCSANQQ